MTLCNYELSIVHICLITETSYLAHTCYFSHFIYLALLTTYISLEPSYMVQLCTCTGATHREEIIELCTIFVKS